MAIEIKPLKELLAMTKEKLDETMAPIRARSAKAKADLKQSEIDEQLIKLEHEIIEKCAKKDIDFDSIVDKMDEYALLERKQKQIGDLIKQLFPE